MLAVTNHDFRDMRPDVDVVRELLSHGWPRTSRTCPSGSARRCRRCGRHSACEPAAAVRAGRRRLQAIGDGQARLAGRVRDPHLRSAALAGSQDRGRNLPPRQLRHRRAFPRVAVRVRRGDVPAAGARAHRRGRQQSLRRRRPWSTLDAATGRRARRRLEHGRRQAARRRSEPRRRWLRASPRVSKSSVMRPERIDRRCAVPHGPGGHGRSRAVLVRPEGRRVPDRRRRPPGRPSGDHAGSAVRHDREPQSRSRRRRPSLRATPST